MADYTLQDLEAGIRAADAAGDAESVKMLGAEYVKMQDTDKHSSEEYEAPKKKSRSTLENIGTMAKTALGMGVSLSPFSQKAGAVRGAVAEPIAAMATGAVAKPVSELAGLGTIAYDAATGSTADPQAVQVGVREKLSYQPETMAGKSPYNPINALAMATGKGIAAVTPEKAAPGEASTLAGMARNALSEAVPQTIGILGAKYAPKAAAPSQKAAKALRTGAEDLMQSALKPTPKDLMNGKAAKAIDTMLEKDIPATPKGIEQIRTRIDELNDQIKEAIATSPERVETRKMMRPIVQKLKDFKEQARPNADIKVIKETWDEFKNHPLLQHETPAKVIPAKVDPQTGATTPGKVIPASGKEDMSVQVAQKIKQGTYRQLAKKYGQLGSADVEAQKAIARGLKEQVAEKVPKVAPLNLEESKLLNVLSVAERKIVTEANKNPMGLSLLTKDPKAWAMFMADRSAAAKSLLARIMNRASQKLTGTSAEKAAEGVSVVAPAQTDKEKRKQYEMKQSRGQEDTQQRSLSEGLAQ